MIFCNYELIVQLEKQLCFVILNLWVLLDSMKSGTKRECNHLQTNWNINNATKYSSANVVMGFHKNRVFDEKVQRVDMIHGLPHENPMEDPFISTVFCACRLCCLQKTSYKRPIDLTKETATFHIHRCERKYANYMKTVCSECQGSNCHGTAMPVLHDTKILGPMQ